jgi:hypothetical protein
MYLIYPYTLKSYILVLSTADFLFPAMVETRGLFLGNVDNCLHKADKLVLRSVIAQFLVKSTQAQIISRLVMAKVRHKVGRKFFLINSTSGYIPTAVGPECLATWFLLNAVRELFPGLYCSHRK